MATLLYSLASPYARVPRVAIRYLTIQGINEVVANPFDNQAELVDANPLAKIPCLILDDTTALFDSEVILRYLDSKHEHEKLFDKGNNWRRATDYSMAKGLMDSAVGLRQEQMREDEGVRSSFWTERFQSAIIRTVEHIESQKNYLFDTSELNAERLILICTLSYVDFRHSELKWQLHAPQLSSWVSEMLKRPWFTETKPN